MKLFSALLLLIPSLLLAQPTQPKQPASPLQAIQDEGVFDSTVRNAVNYNFYALQLLPNADAGQIRSVTVCTLNLIDTYVLTYSASGNCFHTAAGGGGGGSGSFTGLTVSGAAAFGTGSNLPTAISICDTSCSNPTTIGGFTTGSGFAVGGPLQDTIPTTVAVIGTTCTAGQLGIYGVVVTDATSPSIGSTVAGSGSAKAQVWCNGSHWSVTGV
jgi:hypothetical protein